MNGVMGGRELCVEMAVDRDGWRVGSAAVVVVVVRHLALIRPKSRRHTPAPPPVPDREPTKGATSPRRPSYSVGIVIFEVGGLAFGKRWEG
jgi:hypothetical protein